MADNNNLSSFTKFVPGFDFLQGLVKNAGAALPGIGQWVAPTLNPEELEKRIEELRTVQFWLEQNARMLGATIQALEVQRMTLSTLKTMNVPIAELGRALQVPQPVMPALPEVPAAVKKAAGAAKAKAPLAVDPMQWWSALSQQFTQLAATAMKDQATEAAKGLAGALVKQSFDAAGETLKKAATLPVAVAGSVVGAAVKKTAAKTSAARKPAASSTAAARKTRRK